MFTASTPDGVVAAYFWDGNSVQRVIGTGDSASGLVVNELSNIAGAGGGFLIVTASSSYATRELRSFDGAKLTVVQSTDTTAFDGFGFYYYWSNECTVAANGDAHCMAATQDGGVGIFAHRQGRDVVVARSRDRLPGGEWMIAPLSLSSSPREGSTSLRTCTRTGTNSSRSTKRFRNKDLRSERSAYEGGIPAGMRAESHGGSGTNRPVYNRDRVESAPRRPSVCASAQPTRGTSCGFDASRVS